MRNYTKLFAIFSLLALVATSCSDDAEDLKPDGGNEAVVVIKPKIDIEILSRAMSDGSNVDKLVVATFKGDESTPTVRKVLDLADAVANGVELRLVSGLSYKVLFWAYDADNTAYTVGSDGIITANYDSYLTGGFAKMEQLDAFYVVDAFTVTGSFNRNVTLTRPFAQMSFADKATRPTSGTHSCKVSYTAVPTSFNPFTGQTSGSADLTFTYTDFPEETITQDENTYYYVATTYLFPTPSAKIDATCVLYSGATELTRHQLSNLPMAANYRTNILGTMVQAPDVIWDGSTTTEPTVDASNRYIIAKASDLAWLASNGSTLEQNRTFIVTSDLDMDSKLLTEVQLPNGSTIEGNNHTINNVYTSTSALFGNLSNITINNLTINYSPAQSGRPAKSRNGAENAGGLINTLTGSGHFSNVTINGANVVTDGNAGGFIGYVVRNTPTDQGESLSVTFDNCHIQNATISGGNASGKFVGAISGYDNGESISFSSNCSATDCTVTGAASHYVEGGEACWLADTDFSAYNSWLGGQTYGRANVSFGGQAFITKWGGVNITQPISANGSYYIYTADDLAWLQGKDVANVVIKSDIDLAGHRFTPIKKVANLDGENHTIYDLYVDIIHDGYMGAGFIALAEGTTIHKNLIFERANIRCLHNPAIGNGQSTAGNAYAGTLLGTASYATYTCENIHCRNGKIYAVCKIGGLFGRTMYGNVNVKNCSVENYNIENYDPGVKEDFVSYGEVGGLIGFLDAEQATVESCAVTNTVINAKHYTGIGSLLPGRHVNQFIGDIRTHTTETRIYLNSNSVSGNSYTGDSDKYNCGSLFRPKYVEIIGLCYYVYTSEGKGQVYVDGTKVFG